MLIVDDSTRENIQRLKKFADERRLYLPDILRIMGGAAPPGDDENRRVELGGGWKAVYTIEQHPSGWYQHISISVAGKKQPAKAAVMLLLGLFQLPPVQQAAHQWWEKTPDGNAVNLMFPVQ